MKLPIIKKIATDQNLLETDLYNAVKVLESIAQARGVSEEELDVIGELISNIEGCALRSCLRVCDPRPVSRTCSS